ncbi:MAG: amidohydrolase [Gammaproteobacteria bacterium]|jgi:hypothetical protein|nr:amidohydrolase [Gammaproteobacteria bacterium]
MRHDPEGTRLPIKLDAASNAEFAPRPLSAAERRARRQALRDADANARRAGLPRRRFLVSLCGAASTLLSFNMANAARGVHGGFFDIHREAALDPELAQAAVGPAADEFIFDVQGHYLPPRTAAALKPRCAADHPALSRDYLACLGAESFIKDVFMDSDTDMMVLSFVPSARDAEPLTIEEADATRRIVELMEGSHRLLLHGRVNPNQAGDLEDMERLAGFGISAWKTYTQWGPDQQGYYLDDDTGIAFIERARELGVRNICVHKGIPFGTDSYEHSTCRDIGVVARRYPDVNFLVYHSGWVPGKAEGPYDPDRQDGVDALVTSLRENGIGPGGNVYPELGSTWRYLSMRDPDSAAHTLGKLLKYAGERNVLWGTDSVWYGSPQDQIQAMRSFQIAGPLREAHGYPEITPALRARIFGGNALRIYDVKRTGERSGADAVARAREEYRQDPDPHFLSHGPTTRRDFLRLRHPV